jgi:hypothetical protein
MAAANPYALDPLLAQGFSNLTKALIGDPQSDVYGAKADLLRQQVQQSKASANASNSLAALRAEQRRLEALKTSYMETGNSALAAAVADPAIAASIGQTLNLVAPDSKQFGPRIGNVAGTSMPANMPTQDAYAGLVRHFLGGGLPGNPQQNMAAAQTLADMGQQYQGVEMLKGTNMDPARMAQLLMGGELTKYFDQGFAQKESTDDLEGVKYQADQERIAADNLALAMYGPDGSARAIAEIEGQTDIDVAGTQADSAAAVAKIEGATLEAIARGEAVTSIEVANLSNASAERIATSEINAQKIIASNLNISKEKMNELEWDSKEDIAAALNLSTEKIAALGNTKEERIAAALNLSTLEIEKLGFTSAEAIAKALNLTSIEIANLKNAAGITMNTADNATQLSIAELMIAGDKDIATAADIAAIQMNDANNAAMLTATNADNVTKTAIAAADNANALKIAQAEIDGKPIILNPGQSAYTAQGGQAVASATAEPDFTLKEGEVRFVLQTDGSFKQVQGPGKPVKLVAGEGQTVTLVNSETGKVIKTVQGTAKGEILTAGEGETVVMVDSTGQEIAKVEGRAKTFAPNSTTNSTDEWKYNTNFDKDFKATGSPDFNGPMVAALKSAGNAVIKAKMAADPSLSRQQAYAKFILPMIGEVKLVNYGYDFNMPLHFYNGYARKINSVRTNPEELAEAKTRLIQHATTTLGLDEGQAKGIYDQIIAGR